MAQKQQQEQRQQQRLQQQRLPACWRQRRRRRQAPAQAILLLLLLLALAAQASHNPELSKNDAEFIGWEGESFKPEQTFGGGGGGGGAPDSRGWVETLSWEPRAYLYHNFASAEECEHLISLAKPHLQKSQVVDSDTGQFVFDTARTSSGFFLKREQDAVVAAIERRMAEWARLPLENGEPLHVLRYQDGEQYTPHFDYLFDEVNKRNGGQRVATALLYLSDVEAGGETVFPSSRFKPDVEAATRAGFSECGRQGVAVRPRRGDCLLFWSVKPDGNTTDTRSLHAGCPVSRGVKFSATKWIRQHAHEVY